MPRPIIHVSTGVVIRKAIAKPPSRADHNGPSDSWVSIAPGEGDDGVVDHFHDGDGDGVGGERDLEGGLEVQAAPSHREVREEGGEKPAQAVAP